MVWKNDSGQFQALKATKLPSLLQTGSNSSHFLFEGMLESAHEALHIAGADLRERGHCHLKQVPLS